MPNTFHLLVTCLAMSTAGCDGCGKGIVFVQKNIIPDGGPVSFREAAQATGFNSAESCTRVPNMLARDFDARDERVFLVLYWATWSAPDKLLIPVVESEVAREAHRWRLFKSDIDEQELAASACDIRSIPTLVAFVRGKPVARIVGAVPAAKVRAFLESTSGKKRE